MNWINVAQGKGQRLAVVICRIAWKKDDCLPRWLVRN